MVTAFNDVYDDFLLQITDYSYISLNEQELNLELFKLMKKSLAKCLTIKNAIPNELMEQFNRQLEPMEITIITTGMLSEWLKQKIYNIQLLKQSLSSKDFTSYSQANHLRELLELKKETDKDFHYWLNRFSWCNSSKGGGK